MKIIFRIFAVGILVISGMLGGTAWRRLCLPLWGVQVSVNGQVQSQASAQTCPNGLIRLVIPGQSAVLIDGDLRGGSYPGTQFISIFGLTFANDPNPGGVSLDDRVKIETPPDFEFTSNSIAYTDFQTHNRIVVTIAK